MIPSIEKIELGVMNYRDFNFRQNLMVFRVTDISNIVNHECDCLILSKSGYLTEIEIKRSYADFLADFKKNSGRGHSTDSHIKAFYFLVHESFSERVRKYLEEDKKLPEAIYVYDDRGVIVNHISQFQMKEDIGKKCGCSPYLVSGLNWFSCWHSPKKLFIEEQFQLARLGSMRYRTMTEKLIKQ